MTAFKIYLANILTITLTVISSTPTCCAESNNKILRFCVTGDSRNINKQNDGINAEILNRLVIEIKEEKPEFVLFTGDLVKGYNTAEKLKQQLLAWRKIFMKPLVKSGIKVYPCRGNHDLVRLNKTDSEKVNFETSYKIWNQVFSKNFTLPQNGPAGEKNITYQINNNNVVIFCLDAYTPNRKHRVNTKWLEKQLKKIKDKHIFIFTHEPAFSVRHQDCLDDYPEERDKMVYSFIDAGGKAMFFGHDHRYNHAKIKINDINLHQFVIGTAGAPKNSWDYMYSDSKVYGILDNQCYGYLLVEISENKAVLIMKGWEKNGKTKVLDTYKYELKKEKGEKNNV